MKLEEIIIHIGMHKTGTTSIQRTLSKNLNDSNFAYIKLQRVNHSREIFTLFREKKHPSKEDIFNTESEKMNILTKKRLIDNFNQNRDKKLILSGEGIIRISKNGLMNFKIFLEKYFKKITIVAYIRSPKGYMESALEQIIKDGTSSFNLNTDLKRVYPHYREFNKFFKVFGENNVKLWKFDPAIFSDKNVVIDFCQKLGINMDIKDIINDNKSISKEALSLLYIYKKFGPKYKADQDAIQENNKLIKILGQIDGSKLKLSSNVVNHILTKHKNDILWIENILNTTFNEKDDYSSNSIKSEEDFLNIDLYTIEKLKNILKAKTSIEKIKMQTPEDISKSIDMLQDKHHKIEIIQYWADSKLPDDINLLTNSWKETNKNYKHIIYTKKDAENFMKNNYEKEVYEAFLIVKIPAMQADIFRVAYILKNGGLYVDCGTKSLQPIENILDKTSKLVLMRKWHGRIFNGFIYSKESNNSVLKVIWNKIKNNILLKKEGNIAEVTGPILFQRILQKSEYIDKCTIIDELNVKNIFEMVRGLKHRGPLHWSRMQNIESLYTDTFSYSPKPISNIKALQSKQIIIHMGQYSTQSKYIQDYLTFITKYHPNILYPNTGRKLSNHNNIASILSSSNNEIIDIFFKEFYNEIISSQKNIIIISSELFSSLNILEFNKVKMTRLWKRLNQLIEPFNKKNIVYYTREQASSIEARLNESIQNSKCIKNINIKGILKNPTLDYSLFKTALQKYFLNSKISSKIYGHNKLLNYNDLYNNLFKNLLPRQEDIGWRFNKNDSLIKSITLAKILLAINNTNYTISEKVKLKNIFIKKLPNNSNFRLLSHDDIKMIRESFITSNRESNILFNKKQISIENFSEDIYSIEDINIKNLILKYFPKLKNQKISTFNDLLKKILINRGLININV